MARTPGARRSACAAPLAVRTGTPRRSLCAPARLAARCAHRRAGGRSADARCGPPLTRTNLPGCPQASYTSGNVALAFGLVIAAGACTCLGAALVFCSSLTNHRVLSGALGVSAGVMVYVSFVEIFSAKAIVAFQEYGYGPNEAARYATFTFFAGALFTWLLDKLVHCVMHAADAAGQRRERRAARRAAAAVDVEAGGADADAAAATAAPKDPALSAPACQLVATPAQPQLRRGGCDCGGGAAADQARPLDAASDAASGSSGSLTLALAASGACEICDGGSHCPHGPPRALPKSASPGVARVLEADHHAALARTGVLSALAVGLHNLPEGLATFVAALASPSAGAAIAFAIALHNIPEGIVVAMPIYYATGSKWKGFMWSLISGISEPIGGLIGYALLVSSGGGLASPLAFAVTFAFVAGMMVYIAIRELLPTALRFDPEDRYATLGFFGGAAVMAGSLLLFKM
ncbi:MAG: zinc transporter ZIP [Monoraphidium minutum]|nr:MAG: zinc transporter ZIP [Monoraphidium minutum]